MTMTFRAMNTDVTMIAPTLDACAEHELTQRIAGRFSESEKRFSRFREDSELSELNRAGRLACASPAFLDALVRARRYVRLTAGRFNPAIGRALAASGYDRSFVAGDMDRSELRECEPAPSFDDVQFDLVTREVRMPEGVSLDFGGFIKGWTVDCAAALLPGVGAIDAGGDAAVRGPGPDGAGWLVDVEDPADAERTIVTLRVADRAVATSAPNRRRWQAGGRDKHHIIDPTTGTPAETYLAQVTVVAPCAELADVLAKSAFILGASEGRQLLARDPGVGGILVHTAGTWELVGSVEVADAA